MNMMEEQVKVEMEMEMEVRSRRHLISLAGKCGGGSITHHVQHFHLVTLHQHTHRHEPYLKSVIKKLITEIESTRGYVIDGITITQGRVFIPLRCSLNMLQGDTGCALWPSCLFLSEFILSFPEVFTRKSCFEVGSGVGLVGICLQHADASQVILTDGDASTLANLKVNLEMNKIGGVDGGSFCGLDAVQCVHLPWESARERELQPFMPDIVLGADVIYDPSCLPHLVGVLARREKTADTHKAEYGVVKILVT